MALRRWILIILVWVVGAASIQAHEEAPAPRISYYLMADANGVQQVYQHQLDGQAEARQITHAAKDVLTFGAASDGLSVAYVSDGQLWLQPLHTDEAESLATLSATQFWRSPVYSQDGQYIAYADKGLWLLDLSTRKTRELLTDADAGADGSNAANFRIYQPDQFVLGADGKVSKLVVDTGIWEWNTVGVYDLATGEFQLLEDEFHTDLLPLSDGRVLLYGNTGVGGEAGLHVAESLDAINTYKEVVKFGSVTQATLFADQAVELEPGVVRISGQTISGFPDEVKFFYVDYNLTTNVVGQLHMVTVSNTSGGTVIEGKLSPDGTMMPVYQDATFTDTGALYGSFSLIDLSKNDAATALDGKIGSFHWQQ